MSSADEHREGVDAAGSVRSLVRSLDVEPTDFVDGTDELGEALMDARVLLGLIEWALRTERSFVAHQLLRGLADEVERIRRLAATATLSRMDPADGVPIDLLAGRFREQGATQGDAIAAAKCITESHSGAWTTGHGVGRLGIPSQAG